uniref:Uncharacterized protein n=1 Tax=Plectus sambesii TaxID=2011161 RepID=A0A914VEV5_9BILA
MTTNDARPSTRPPSALGRHPATFRVDASSRLEFGQDARPSSSSLDPVFTRRIAVRADDRTRTSAPKRPSVLAPIIRNAHSTRARSPAILVVVLRLRPTVTDRLAGYPPTPKT